MAKPRTSFRVSPGLKIESSTRKTCPKASLIVRTKTMSSPVSISWFSILLLPFEKNPQVIEKPRIRWKRVAKVEAVSVSERVASPNQQVPKLTQGLRPDYAGNIRSTSDVQDLNVYTRNCSSDNQVGQVHSVRERCRRLIDIKTTPRPKLRRIR